MFDISCLYVSSRSIKCAHLPRRLGGSLFPYRRKAFGSRLNTNCVSFSLLDGLCFCRFRVEHFSRYAYENCLIEA